MPQSALVMAPDAAPLVVSVTLPDGRSQTFHLPPDCRLIVEHPSLPPKHADRRAHLRLL